MKSIKVILVDDHELVRTGIRSLIQNISGVEVIAEANNGRDAVRLIDELMPDLVLLDIAMPELNGLEVVSRISKDNTNTKVIILSMHKNEEYVVQALKAGAAGYLLKDSSANELEIAVNAVIRGETYLSPAISKHVVDNYLRRITDVQADKDKGPDIFKQLTSRQREILQLIAEGNSTKEIANKLNVSIKTVETHRMQLMDRIGIHDVAGLVRYAIRMGIITVKMPDIN
ncbi:MAG: response regulator transcription factor [Ignavibacteriaceae bacterium]|jgi:DNA-binding NarL/FixJ family response regulator|nr:response regulator transcription factor [Ignavibacteriaceae bacterium]